MIAFYAAAHYISDPTCDFMDEDVDDLCRQNKLPESAFDLITEFAEELRDMMIYEDVSCSELFDDVTHPENKTKTMQRLYARRDLFIEETQESLSTTAFDPDEEEDVAEADEEEEQIRTAQSIFDGMTSNMTARENDLLLDVMIEVERIARCEPLHLYVARFSAIPE